MPNGEPGQRFDLLLEGGSLSSLGETLGTGVESVGAEFPVTTVESVTCTEYDQVEWQLTPQFGADLLRIVRYQCPTRLMSGSFRDGHLRLYLTIRSDRQGAPVLISL